MQQYGRHAPASVRFWRHVTFEPNSGCWLWVGGHNGLGYGRIWIGNGAREYAHRYSYRMHKGEIGEGLELDHLCRTPSCVNPSHLEPVTHSVNIKRSPLGNIQTNRAAREQLQKTECRHGHPLSGGNLYVYVTRDGKAHRACRTCRNRKKPEVVERTRQNLARRKATDVAFVKRRRAYQAEWARKDRARKRGNDDQSV